MRTSALVDLESSRSLCELRGHGLASSHGVASGKGETERENDVLHEIHPKRKGLRITGEKWF
jgi:hypothetical protein